MSSSAFECHNSRTMGRVFSSKDKTHEKKPVALWISSVVPDFVTRRIPGQTTSKHDASQDYLTGVRGSLAIMSFLWVFMQTFVPAAVAHSANTTGPSYQIMLRRTLSVLFCSDSMIYSSIIFLSARTICLPFLLDSTKVTLASSVFRRGLRMAPPTAVALIVVYVLFSKTIKTDYLSTFTSLTSNASMVASIYALPSPLANFNAIFEIFWTSNTLSYQGGYVSLPTTY